MCGILAVLEILHGEVGSYRKEVVNRVKRIRHRGPDWSGVYTGDTHILAHERLAIVDVESGQQPLQSLSGNLFLAVNGEIYNHESLQSQHNLPPGRTRSDCEVILGLYEKLGTTFLNEVNGIFAFVLIDEKQNQFMIARDHMGIIPLYWGRDAKGALWVASELKALHDVCETFEEFPPGHVFVNNQHAGILQKWYTPEWHKEDYMPSECPEEKFQVLSTKLKEHLTRAVKDQLMSDVPFGVLLSGGLDSSLVAALAKQLIGNDRVLHTFSIGLEGSPDLAMARQVAADIGTKHHEFLFTVQEGLDAYADVVCHLETYDVTTIRAATPMYLMSRKIKALGFKMVLSGEGSDELFGGYLYFHKCPNREEFQSETRRKLMLLHKFDCLRANKSTAAWGVEARVPFLDKSLVDFVMNEVDPWLRMCGSRFFTDMHRQMEKWFLRQSFVGLLSENVLWRQKEQFSDGVGYSWIDSIRAEAEKSVSNEQMKNAKETFPENTPTTKEGYFARSIFEKHYPGKMAALCVPGGPSIACSTPAAIKWDAEFEKFADCSGRSVSGVHQNAYRAL